MAAAGAGGAGAGEKPTVKLYYFNAPGRAFVIRLAFAATGFEFEDYRFKDGAEFGAMRSEFPQTLVPVLEINGTKIGQSDGLLRLAGRLTNQYPEDPVQAALVDQALGGCTDMLQGYAKIFYNKELDDAEKAKQLAEHAATSLPKWGGAFERQIASNSEDGTWLVGDSMTVADIAVFAGFAQLQQRKVVTLDAETYPRLTKLVAAVGENEGIKAWIAAHTKSE